MSETKAAPSRLKAWTAAFVRGLFPFLDRVVLPVAWVFIAAYLLVPRIRELARSLWFPASEADLLVFATVVMAVAAFYMLQHLARVRRWKRTRVLGIALGAGTAAIVLLFAHQALKYTCLVPVNASWLEHLRLAPAESTATGTTPSGWVVRPFTLPAGLVEELEVAGDGAAAPMRLVDFISDRPEEFCDLVFDEAPLQMLWVSVLFYLSYLGVVLAFSIAIATAKEVPGDELQEFLMGLADLIEGRDREEREHVLERPPPQSAAQLPAGEPDAEPAPR